jgi:hypothetical protein
MNVSSARKRKMYEIKLRCLNCSETYWDTTEEISNTFKFAKFKHICESRILGKSQKIIGICEVIAYREVK